MQEQLLLRVGGGPRGPILWPEHMTREWFDYEVNVKGVSPFGLAISFGISAQTLWTKLQKLGVRVERSPYSKHSFHVKDGVTVRCYPALIRALDKAQHPPQTIEQALPWVERWQGIERELNPGQAGCKAALWITPHDILVIVCTKKYRVDKTYMMKTWSPGVLQLVKRCYLGYRGDALSLHKIAQQIQPQVKELTWKQIYAILRRHAKEWRESTREKEVGACR